MACKLKNLVIKAVALCDEGACSAAHIKIVKTKSKEVNTMSFEELMKSLPEDQQKIIRDELNKKAEEVPTHIAEELKTVKDDLVKAKEDLAKAKSQPTPGTSEEELLKNVDPAVRALIESARTQAAAAQAAVLKMKEEAEDAECLAKAKTLADTGIPEADLKDILKSAKKVEGDFSDKLYTMLQTVNKAMQESDAFVATGSDNQGITKGCRGAQATEAVTQEINKVAEDIAKATGCTKEQAFTKALMENPELYNRYMATLED